MAEKFKIDDLSVLDVNILAAALRSQPYAQVAELIQRIEKQIRSQADESQKPQELKLKKVT